ncbi:MAG: hypothetical protein AUH43_06615 [Acidobacteria bacterium 13_1_40CM_65_14]|nr:MAG: hypothetical protein AUH43_06615 [Acidobacteria bacterium 13_1_40CM_65_14]
MLLAARNAARQREFSLRTALGGSRARLFRQLVTESLALVAAGTVCGWLFGVRMALGAERRQVVWMVMRESLILSIIGIGVGLPLAIAGARLLKAMLFGITAGDPISFAAALGGIAVVAIGASLIPASRAASVNPIVALRYE